MITLKNGLIISADNNGFESINHLTSKIDKGSFTKFNELPDIFYKEMDTDDRTLLTKLNNPELSTILQRTKQYGI
jgi:hypothetical protein